jgi:alkyl hydroperoxide reductase subunit AhpC
VAHFVQPGSPLDREATNRGNSVYLPDRVLPMLPEILSNALSSLQQDHVRFTKSAFIEFTADGIPTHCDLANTAIKVTRRFAYEEVMPIIADPDKKVATLYDMIHPNAIDNMTVRSVFIVGPDKKVKLTLTYPASCGRNFDELLRVIDSLQLTSKFKVATPANWKDGEDCIITPAVNDDEAKTLFPKGFKTVKPYLRYTPQPNK